MPSDADGGSTARCVVISAPAADIQRAARHESHLYRDSPSRTELTEEIMRTYGLSMEEAAGQEGRRLRATISGSARSFHRRHDQQVSVRLQFYLASGSGRSQPIQILICGGCATYPAWRMSLEPVGGACGQG